MRKFLTFFILIFSFVAIFSGDFHVGFLSFDKISITMHEISKDFYSIKEDERELKNNTIITILFKYDIISEYDFFLKSNNVYEKNKEYFNTLNILSSIYYIANSAPFIIYEFDQSYTYNDIYNLISSVHNHSYINRIFIESRKINNSSLSAIKPFANFDLKVNGLVYNFGFGNVELIEFIAPSNGTYPINIIPVNGYEDNHSVSMSYYIE